MEAQRQAEAAAAAAGETACELASRFQRAEAQAAALLKAAASLASEVGQGRLEAQGLADLLRGGSGQRAGGATRSAARGPRRQ